MEINIPFKEHTNLYTVSFPFNAFFNDFSYENNMIMHNHWHEYIEIILILKGNALFILGGQEHEVKENDFLFVNSNVFHTGFAIKNTDTIFYSIVFDTSILTLYPSDPNYIRFISPLQENKTMLPVRLTKDEEGNTLVLDLLKRIITEFENKKPGYETIIKSYIITIIMYTIRESKVCLDTKNVEGLLTKHYDSFNKLIKFIETNYSERITTGQAADIVNLSPYYFCRLFKKITGNTFNDFLNIIRVNKAEEMLRNTDFSVTLVAELTGFCDISYFDKVFKLYKRYTPKDCRKSEKI